MAVAVSMTAPPCTTSGAAVCDLGADEQDVNASKAAGITTRAASFNRVLFIDRSPFFLLSAGLFLIASYSLKFINFDRRYRPGPYHHQATRRRPEF
jgi:hypothetical protein